MKLWSAVKINSVLYAGIFVLGASTPSLAAQITFEGACTFVVHVPGFFGGTDIDFHVAQGAVFHENENHRFCGPVRQPTPMGDASTTKCVGIDGKKINFVSGMDDFSRSDCIVSDANTSAADAIKSRNAAPPPASRTASTANAPTPHKAAVAPLASVGAWSIDDKASQLDGSRNYSAVLSSSNTIPNSIGVLDAAHLVVRCKQGKLELYIHWPPFMGDGDHSVQWKFDQGQIWKQDWSGSEDGTATFNPAPREFLSDMQSAHKLVVDVYPYQSESVEAIFDLTGANTVVATAFQACPND